MKTMPNSTQEEKHRWIRPILNGEITIKGMAKVCTFSERALIFLILDLLNRHSAGRRGRGGVNT